MIQTAMLRKMVFFKIQVVLILGLCQICPGKSHAMFEPSQSEATGLSIYLDRLISLGINDIKSHFSLHKNLSQTPTDLGRYLFSPKWGWLDMRHFTLLSRIRSFPLVGFSSALRLGELIEKDQERKGNSSAWSYEDLNSNLIGAYFPFYKKRKCIRKPYLGCLQAFLQALGFSEKPAVLAPNWDQVRKEKNSPNTGPKNRTYKPLFTPSAFPNRGNPTWNELDQELLDRIP